MFFYLSLLVELNLFEEITMGYLIVGHIHITIDQFSVFFAKLSKVVALLEHPWRCIIYTRRVPMIYE
jgi:hypothetical protein